MLFFLFLLFHRSLFLSSQTPHSSSCLFTASDGSVYDLSRLPHPLYAEWKGSPRGRVDWWPCERSTECKGYACLQSQGSPSESKSMPRSFSLGKVRKFLSLETNPSGGLVLQLSSGDTGLDILSIEGSLTIFHQAAMESSVQ